jgi:subtilisin family serine protease
MRRLTRIVSGTAIASLVALSMPQAADATPKPLARQWWFPAWAVNNKIWPVTQGKGVTVGLVDTGVQADIPDFSGAIILPGTDETGGGTDGRTDTDTAAVAGHGTSMASLIVSQGRGTGFMGIAPKAKILPIVADSIDSTTRGIRYAADHGAKVINISLGGPGRCNTSLQEAVSYANKKDVIVVAASGDYGRGTNAPLSPADCSGVLAVGAIDNQLKPWSGTERQPYVAISAPGVAVIGVLKDGRIHTSNGGTSGAAALTSGGIALLRSRFPDESRTDILKRVFASLRDGGTPGKDDATGYGVFRPARVLGASVPDSAAYEEWASGGGGTFGHTHAPPTPFHFRDQGVGHNVWGIAKLALLLLGVGVIAVVVALVIFSRQRRRAPAYRGQMPSRPGGPGQAGPGPGGPGLYRQGPPPAFGPPRNQGRPPERR